MLKRKICAVTGSRADYGILYPVLKSIETYSNLELSLIVTGMHLSPGCGDTIQEIEKDGFKIDTKVYILLESDTLGAMAKSVSLGIGGMAQAWEQLKPDIILVLGDRVEALSAAITGAHMNIPVAHIHGGDTCSGGNIDDANRFAITKFAHVHFPATPKSAERIIKMGENEWRVYVVGSPALDALQNGPLFSREVLARRFGFNLLEPLILLVQHPVTIQVTEAANQMRETLEAIVELSYPTIIIYPNTDAGSRKMVGVIKEFDESFATIRTFGSLPHKEYLSLMKVARVMVGNSSSGIIEAPSLGLPVVNIGIRQEGREHGKNIINVRHDKQEIMEGIQKSLGGVREYGGPYGDGKAGPMIAKILSELEITPQLLQKRITY